MEWLAKQAVTLMTAWFFAFALIHSGPSTLLVVGAIALTLGALFAVRLLAAPSVRELTVGARAREHREVLGTLPEPQHPDTDGRPRSRAPSRRVPTAAFLSA